MGMFEASHRFGMIDDCLGQFLDSLTLMRPHLDDGGSGIRQFDGLEDRCFVEEAGVFFPGVVGHGF